MVLGGRTLKFIRVKSISNSKIIVGKDGLRYATNGQVMRDTAFTKNKYTRRLWIQMFSRYGKMFVKNAIKIKTPLLKKINYSRYGV